MEILQVVHSYMKHTTGQTAIFVCVCDYEIKGKKIFEFKQNFLSFISKQQVVNDNRKMSVIPQQEKIAPAYLFYFQRTLETVWILIYNRNWLLQHHLTQFPFYFFIYTQGYNDLSDFI